MRLCPGTDISAQVIPIGVKFCTILELCPGQSFSLLVVIFLGAANAGSRKGDGSVVLGL